MVPPQDQIPFMEHPTGEFETALQAIESAMARLAQMDMGHRWIVFSGQGQGSGPDSYQIEDVPFSGQTFDLGNERVSIQDVLDYAGLSDTEVEPHGAPDGKITLHGASPAHLARFLDAVFRRHFGIKPFDGEEDYAVGAEWLD